ncbi:hypothetical protein [Hyphomicrobium denitrificans]|nr:hypothetical protein [Hyphomicrobium denitrificans]
MEVLKTIVNTAEDGRFYLVDTVEKDGKLWLVTAWLEKGFLPERMVRIDDLRACKATPSPDGRQRAHYALDKPLPRALFDGSDLGDLKYQYEVRDGDEV